MCGIFGAVFTDALRPSDVDGVLRALHHRGPDLNGVWRGDRALLAHTRLSIIDLSPAAAQPMLSGDGQAVVVFNGEIYNHHELRRELQALGRTFRSRSDTEVIVEGYRAWGSRVVERLDGMFAFGLWDIGARTLLLARDRPGKKPLFYHRAGGALYFASEVKALVAAGLAPEPAVETFPMLFSFGNLPAPYTPYRSVLQVPPASRLVAEESRAPLVERYWTAPFCQPQAQVDVDTAVRQTRRLVEAAVERRLESDVPLGAFLSGGIDSTIIVGVMSRLSRQKVKTFSIGFSGDARYNETDFARLAAEAFGTDHTEYQVTPDAFDGLERLVDAYDGPFADSSAIPTSLLSKLTRQKVTVALTGDGGDELFCGYQRFLAAEAAEKIPRPLRALLRHAPRGGASRDARMLWARVQRFLSAAALPLGDRLTAWNGLFALELDALFRPEWRGRLQIGEPMRWVERLVDGFPPATTLARTLAFNFETYLPDDLLVKADRCSMAYGLETRSPFLDTALIELVARLPNRMKRRGTSTKWILKRAFADMLPAPILARGKMGFGVPLGTWFRNDLRPFLEERLSASAALCEYVNPACVQRLLQEHFAGRADHGHKLWLLLTFEVWLRSLTRTRATSAQDLAV